MIATSTIRPIFLAIPSAVALVLFFLPIGSYDTWWHLDSGLWMLDHGTVLREEIRTFTAEGYPWVNSEWFFQVLLALQYKLAGDYGLVIFKAIIWFFLFYFLSITAIKQRSSILPFLFVFALILPIIDTYMYLRPHTLASLFLVMLVYLFNKESSKINICILFLLMIVWINSHLSFIVGLCAAGLHILFDKSVIRQVPVVLHRFLIAALLGFTVYLNPFQLELLSAIFKVGNNVLMHTYIQEWMRIENYPPVFIFFIVAIVVGYTKKIIPIRPGELFLIAFFFFHSLESHRFLLQLGVVMVHPATVVMTHLYKTLPKNKIAKPFMLFYFIIALFFYVYPTKIPLFNTYSSDYPIIQAMYPESTVDVVTDINASLGRELRVFNAYGFGGYITFRSKATMPIFIDGRYVTIFDDKQFFTSLMGLASPDIFEKVANDYNVDAYLGKIDRKSSHFPMDDRKWILVAYDDASRLILRKEIADQLGWTKVAYDPVIYIPYAADDMVEKSIPQLHQILSVNENNARAWNHLGLFYGFPKNSALKNKAEAIDAFYNALRVIPNNSLASIYLAILLSEEAGNEIEIERLLDRLPETLPKSNPPLEIFVAKLYLEINLAEKALLSLYPSSRNRKQALNRKVGAWIYRGLAYNMLGDPMQALYCASKAAIALPSDPSPDNTKLLNTLLDKMKPDEHK